MQKMTNIGIKKSLTEASLGWKCFRLYNKDREFYAFKNKCLRVYVILYAKALKAGESVLLTGISSQNFFRKNF